MSSDVGWRIKGTSWNQCRSMVQYSFTSTETIRLVRTDNPGRPSRFSHSSWTMTDTMCESPWYNCTCWQAVKGRVAYRHSVWIALIHLYLLTGQKKAELLTDTMCQSPWYTCRHLLTGRKRPSCLPAQCVSELTRTCWRRAGRRWARAASPRCWRRSCGWRFRAGGCRRGRRSSLFRPRRPPPTRWVYVSGGIALGMWFLLNDVWVGCGGGGVSVCVCCVCVKRTKRRKKKNGQKRILTSWNTYRFSPLSEDGLFSGKIYKPSMNN